jgi:hypothetical protein
MSIIKCLYCKENFKSRSKKRKYCSHNCYSQSRIGEKRNIDVKGYKNANWKGGRRYDKDGYILIHSPYHPFCDGDGYVREHRLVMEKYIKRFLKKKEVVHHINENRKDNKIENLELLFKKEHDRNNAIKRMANGFRLPKRKKVNGKLVFVK